MPRASTLFRMASAVAREGCLAINKPMGITSAQVVREVQTKFSESKYFQPVISAAADVKAASDARGRGKKKTNRLKLGHGGTLDPLATGILILGLGSGTKSLSQFLDCVKSYEATIVFGAATDTYDRVGRVLSRRPYDHITKEKVLEAMETFKGKQVQIPPLYSALKMNGKPLYEYAREGKPIPREIEGREVEISQLELLEWYPPGSHNHRWPTEEAEAAERNLAEQVWRVKKQQDSNGGKKLTPEEKEEDDQAVAAHESFKRKFEERQDTLIKDSPSKRQRRRQGGKEQAMMSGALGSMPRTEKVKEIMDECMPADPNTPPPWSDIGPPAMKVRMSVSSGFYVRSFCHDLGTKLDSAALMAELCRTRQSDFAVDGPNCLPYDDVFQGEEVWGPKVKDMLARWNGEPESSAYAEVAKSSPKNGTSDARALTPPRSSPKAASQSSSPKSKAPSSNKPEAGSLKRSLSNGSSRSASPHRNVRPKIERVEREVSPGEQSWNGIQD